MDGITFRAMNADIGLRANLLTLICWLFLLTALLTSTTVSLRGESPPSNAWAVDVGPNCDTAPALDSKGIIYVSTWNGRLMAINPDSSIRWVFKTRSDFKSSPTIGPDGAVYIGSHDRKLHAISPQGAEKWAFQTGAWVDATASVGDDGSIYFGSWDGKFYALRPDGSKKWEFTAGGEIISSAAIGERGTIYFGSYDHKLYALNPDGAKQWVFQTGGQVLSSPAIGPQGVIYFTSTDGCLHALNPDGTERWQLHTGGITESSPVLGPQETIYLGVNSNYWAISSEGKKLWSLAIWQNRPTDYVQSTPAIAADGTSFFSTDEGHLWSLRADGQRWKSPALLDGPATSSPAIGPDGTVYVVSYGMRLFAVKGPAPLCDSSWPMFGGNPQHTGRVHPAR